MSENGELYRDLVENSQDLICTHDLNGVLLTVNLAAARTLGYEPAELVHRNLRELLHPNVHDELDAYLISLKEKKSASGLIELWAKSGEVQIWRYTSSLRTEEVQVPFVRAMAHNLTEVLQAQRALQESEERLRIAAEVGKMYAWEWDPVTDSVRRSAECESILGVSGPSGDSVVKDYFSFIHPEDRDKLWTMATSLTPESPSYRTEYRRLRSEGEMVWLGESGHATFDKEGKMIRLVGMTADITERKRAEEKLRASEERSRHIVKSSPVAIVVSRGLDELVELVNDKFTEIFGYTKEDMPSVREWWALAYPDSAYREQINSEWNARVSEAIRNHTEIAPMEAMVCCKDGSSRYIEFHFASLGETNLVSFVDLTDRKKAETEIAKIGGRLIDAQESERTRIARDLHDDINQRLALLMIELEELEGISLQTREGISQLKNKLQARATEILNGVATICHELHPQVLELLSFTAALQSLCREYSDHHKVRIEFTHHEVPHPLPKAISTCLFRVAQEALRNCIRHSCSGAIQVQLFGKSGSLHLAVRDSGVGFEPEAGVHSGGLGLISMRERITLVNGTITIRSEPGAGTEIHCTVPFRKQINEK